MKFSRVWAMPNADTFSIKPIGEFVQRYLAASTVSIDPFAHNKRWATHTNDLSPNTAAEHHMDAEDFLRLMAERGVKADLVVFDPPYSTTQMRLVYQGNGLERDGGGTRNAELYKRVRDAIELVLAPGGGSPELRMEQRRDGQISGLRDAGTDAGSPRRSAQRHHMHRGEEAYAN